MKNHFSFFLFSICSFLSFAQNQDNLFNEHKSSSEIPGSFLVSSNANNTFIKDSANIIYAIAHGYDETKLTGNNCSIKKIKNTNSYEVRATKAGECSISISGHNSTTNKSVPLGTYMFKVVDKIERTITIGDKSTGEFIDGRSTFIGCKNISYWNYEEIILLKEWTLESNGVKFSGTGQSLSKEALKWIASIPANQAIVVKGLADSSFVGEFEVISVFLKQ